MAWLQKRPQVSEAIQFYTLGLNKTVLIVGLGNIGAEYDQTRHNIGFACLDAFVVANPELGGWVEKKDLKCHLVSGQLGQTRVIAIKPTTFVNLSGEAVQNVLNFYKIPLESVVAVYDELAIDFGHIRTRVGGESAGHNGVKSIMEVAGEGFGRVRVGIGPKKPAQIGTADFVLQKFAKKELDQMPALTREVNAILSEYAFANDLPHETRSFVI